MIEGILQSLCEVPEGFHLLLAELHTTNAEKETATDSAQPGEPPRERPAEASTPTREPVDVISDDTPYETPRAPPGSPQDLTHDLNNENVDELLEALAEAESASNETAAKEIMEIMHQENLMDHNVNMDDLNVLLGIDSDESDFGMNEETLEGIIGGINSLQNAELGNIGGEQHGGTVEGQTAPTTHANVNPQNIEHRAVQIDMSPEDALENMSEAELNQLLGELGPEGGNGHAGASDEHATSTSSSFQGQQQPQQQHSQLHVRLHPPEIRK